MRILIISGSYPPMKCGVGDYTAKLIENFKTHGHQAEVLTTRDVGRWVFLSVPKIIRFIRRVNPDIIHIQYPSSEYGKSLMINFLPLFLRLLFPRTRTFCTFHEFKSYTILGKMRVIFSMLVCKKAVMVDPEEARAVRRYFLIARPRFIPIGANVLPNNNFSESIRERRRALGIYNGEIAVAFYGFIQPGKGFEYLIDAFAEFIARYEDAKLLILGELSVVGHYSPMVKKTVKKYQEKIRKKIDNKKINEEIIWTGYLSEAEASRYFPLADIAVFPFDEGGSTRRGSMITAMAYGLPIITTKPSYFKDFYLVKPKSASAILEALVDISSSVELQKKLAESSKKAYRVFHWENVIKDHLELYGK
jgi:glycosyltransferase involved in cell wall biosynthesis